ncbi:hypothetical protein Zm00014a_009476 [Zea mays]|uniref:KIB1-4 beta-propeller domain-containing protein n=1 Tax=Zea mays TaxID=4577 RepID=A0A3L6F4T7_MAIZE|nr:hypothetical protein Zm00014a_009476 [Zea mays]
MFSNLFAKFDYGRSSPPKTPHDDGRRSHMSDLSLERQPRRSSVSVRMEAPVDDDDVTAAPVAEVMSTDHGGHEESSPPKTPHDDGCRSHMSDLSLERQPRQSSVSVRMEAPVDDDDVTAAPVAEVMSMDHGGHEESPTVPCLAFASEHGYSIFSLAYMRMLDGADVRPMPPVPGRRLMTSPYGGTVLATDVCYRHPCYLVNPFTGSRASLPDLPIPFSEKEPIECRSDEPRPRCARVTDDGLAWDWSPRGILVARGDTAFFCEHGGERWTPVHQSQLGSPMTINYRGGLFFVLELHTLKTTVIDAGTLQARAKIPAPPVLGDVDDAYLAPSQDDAILLVHHAGDSNGVIFTNAYRARLRGNRRTPRWKPVLDIGDRAVFIDGAHGFTVTADLEGAKANRVYVILANRLTHPCGRLAVVFDVGFSDLRRPERMGRLKLNTGEVEPMWGQPHWIMPRDRSDRRQGYIN